MLNRIMADEKKKTRILYTVFALLWLVENFLCIRRGDDVGVVSYVRDFGLLKSVWRHIGLGNWSTRFVVDALSYFLIGSVGFSVWRLMNTAVTVILVHFLDRMLNVQKKSSVTLMLMGVFCLFPYAFENTAGWIFTTVTYYWTVMTAVGFIYFMDRLFCEGNLSFREKAVCFVCLVYSCDIETCCIFMLVMMFFMGIDFWLRDRSVPKMLSVSALVAFLRLALHLVWGSFGHRKMVEISTHFPDYVQMSFLDKIQVGFSTAWYVYFVSHPVMMVLLSLSLFAAVFSIRKNLRDRVISSLAFLLICFCKMCSFVGKRFDLGILNSVIRMHAEYDKQYGFVNSQNFYLLQSYVEILIWFVILASISFSVFCIFMERKQAFINFGLLLAGLLSRMVLGFSPTCAASFYRTHVFLAVAILVVLARTLTELRNCNKKLSCWVWGLCIVSGLVCFAGLLQETVVMLSEDPTSVGHWHL